MGYKYAICFALCGFVSCAMAVGGSGARSGSSQKVKVDSISVSTRGKADACILLTGAEIEAVQGEPVNETKASVQPNGEMLVTECLFHTTKFTKSVSVVLATPSSNKPSALTPRKFWQKQFHAPDMEDHEMRAGGKTARKPRPEGEGETLKPRGIAGLGEEAYWVGTPIAGALYVLQGDNFVRISVGGVREESVRIEKSKVLARAAVRRL